MNPIVIDITDRSAELELTQDESNKLMSGLIAGVATSFYQFWKKEVSNSDLKSTKNTYLNAMYINKQDELSWEVGLNPGFMANAIEVGASAFDMKSGFFKSPHKKISKAGKAYFIVPFRIATPEALATAETFSGQMPEEIHKAMTSKAKSGDESQLRLSEIPAQYRAPKTRERVELFDGSIKEAYTHKGSIYEGIQKSNKPSHSRYVSFRVASETSPNAFIHTGIQARNFMSKSLEQFTQTTLGDMQDAVIENFLESR